MVSDRFRAVLHAILLALAGGAIAWASSYGLYATATLATLLVLWIAAIGFTDHPVRLEAPPAPSPPMSPDLEARQRLTAYLDVSPAPLVALEAGRLRVVNRAARRLFGANDLVPDPPETLLAALSGTRPGRTATIDMTDETGTRSFALATGDIAMSGTVTRIGALIDIDAELKAAEATALRELIQVLSHEIVNALTPIASLADTAATMLDDPVPDLPDIREAIETVARRAASLHGSAKATALCRVCRHRFRNGFRSRNSSAIWRNCSRRAGRISGSGSTCRMPRRTSWRTRTS